MSVWGCNVLQPEPQIWQRVTKLFISGMHLERTTIEGESPVRENEEPLGVLLSTTGHEKSCGNLGGPPSKAKYL